jgi:TrmH family RNA methyltransferase|tara:strand:+ start:903 stop:1643 length:741 start_codon:yes stop_codon:yes gene_type:complete
MTAKSNLLKQFRIVLCETSHAGNIGSVARAMKTMGFSNLYLVNPKDFPSKHANALACGAEDLLQNANVVTSLSMALKNINHVVGFTARKRELTQPHENIRELSDKLSNEANNNKIALIFGNETNGLSNIELQQCQTLGFIDANSKYSSLNLAHSVQIVCHEIRMMSNLSDNNNILKKIPKKYVSHQLRSGFYNHLEEILNEIGFLKKIQAERLMMRLRLLFDRTQMEKEEINILRGILSEIKKKLK